MQRELVCVHVFDFDHVFNFLNAYSCVKMHYLIGKTSINTRNLCEYIYTVCVCCVYIYIDFVLVLLFCFILFYSIYYIFYSFPCWCKLRVNLIIVNLMLYKLLRTDVNDPE